MRLALVLALLLPLSSCSTGGYLIETGIGQFKLFNKARPIREVLESPYTSPATKQGIEVVGRAKGFAAAELGMKVTSNYETFVQLEAPCVVWALSASDPLKLEEKKWKFPVVGEVPYLGFYSKQRAEEEAVRLREREQPTPDTWVRCVPAYSSLGWFADPLYSSMLSGKDHNIVELVVHESLHATVWVGNSVDFNEKLANFVGLEGSVLWMRKEKGEAGEAVVRDEVKGEKVFADFMQASIDRYKSTVKDQAAKEAFYRDLPGAYKRFVEERSKAMRFTPVNAKLEGWNNAALSAYGNYYSDMSVFEKLLKRCGGELGRFVQWIRATQEKGDRAFKDDPEKVLAGMAETGTCP